MSTWIENRFGADAQTLKEYMPSHKIRIITATALFDGHDASINIMRRLLQARGAEVIHLGHNRTALEVATAALQEDVHAVALSSYQGGHLEYFKYVRKLLDEGGGSKIKLFGGGGGVIVPDEIADLEANGIEKIYSPEDGQAVGLDGIIGHILKEADFEFEDFAAEQNTLRDFSRALSLLESEKITFDQAEAKLFSERKASKKKIVLGVTGTGGAGKSSLTDEILARFLLDHDDLKVCVFCVDPSKRKTGGALLGDRIRMNAVTDERVFLRSFATRQSGRELAKMTAQAVDLAKRTDFDFIIVETSGIGQGDAQILELSDISLYVMTPEYGAATQLEKIDMLDFADFVAINKFERSQGADAIRDVRTLMRRNRYQGEHKEKDQYPVFGTIASRFADDGVSGLYRAIAAELNKKDSSLNLKPSERRNYSQESTHRDAIIPGERVNYLREISKAVRDYHKETAKQVEYVYSWESLQKTKSILGKSKVFVAELNQEIKNFENKIEPELLDCVKNWDKTLSQYQSDEYVYKVREKDIKVKTYHLSISQKKIPKVAMPKMRSLADVTRYLRNENLPGRFPFVAGVFPFKRQGEDPQRMFAGEGGPHRTNKRFKYLSKESEAKRLSTAFDSVTLYGSDPHTRPDIYGKVGESGVSIATLKDMKDLYADFDLASPTTSVSMTINGPAPIILAFYLNTAIDQQLEAFEKQHSRFPNVDEVAKIKAETLAQVRGTVQADILKEDQAQNTCIFSTEFALKLMGDVQEYFIENKVKNYYSVSISGYHIAEAGANPITQLAFTLANGFTYLEYYLARSMDIDDFAPNQSFFFSNGLDPEYAVIGRVARRIWAIALRDKYGASERSQKLKYHIQTSGRSLHAQEIDFNDIRTTLQALLALYDNCNSLHTNAYDEAITTPTEESVRRALAIQMIITKEFGTHKCENVNQGSFLIEELTDLVEEAVLQEFERISERGGVLGAMEMQYQRSQIQEESLYYESLKDTGELPIIGVNTFLDPNKSSEPAHRELELARASYDEKDDQITRLKSFQDSAGDKKQAALKKLEDVALQRGNVFAEMMHTVRYASLGEITETLYKVGGKYRRAM